VGTARRNPPVRVGAVVIRVMVCAAASFRTQVHVFRRTLSVVALTLAAILAPTATLTRKRVAVTESGVAHL